MKLVRVLLSLSFLAFLIAPAQAQKQDWLPITQQDLDVKQVPNNPGADAIQLYYAHYINGDDYNQFFYRRIKVLNEKGKSYADVEIEVPLNGSVSGLKARTIHPDGSIVEFSGKPLQKLLYKGRGLKFVASTFTMPDVTVGSIIEYKYRFDSPEVVLTESSWTIQQDLYTVKENFLMTPYSGKDGTLLEGFENGFRVASVYSHMPNNIKPVQKGSHYELEVNNMPGFQAEGYMPPEEDFKPQVRFFYVARDVSDTDKFWQEAGRKWNDSVEHFIGNHREISQAATEAIGSETDPEQKLRKLYARAQQIRNLTYEHDRSAEERKKESLKGNQNVADVLVRGQGYRDQITYFFVAMARASGFNVSVVRTSDRRTRFFDKGVLSTDQLTSAIALVTDGGKEIYLDPGTKFCPYGYIHWTRTSSQGLKLDKKGGVFVTVPGAAFDKAMTRRVADMQLDAQGTLKGSITVKFEGNEALSHRLDQLDTDDAGRKKSLEDELKESLPDAATVKVANVEGWEASNDPLVVTFNIEIPGYASAAGKRLLMPPYLFRSRQMEAFKLSDRKFPVYFAYAFAEMDRVNISIPDGFFLESVPPRQDARLDYASYQNLSQFDGKKLVTQRILQVNGIFFAVQIYPSIRDFFNKVEAGDEQQAVLSGGSTNAQKGN